ncbi:MAG: transcriptional regulator [Kiritimatiellae bacterium]|nr:transcriptional regulator [Kiritimatiellia bacterium]
MKRRDCEGLTFFADGVCSIMLQETLTAAETDRSDAFETARDEFVAQWGAISSSWGINRTMAQIHALLLVSTEPMFTDQIMEQLEISRGNAHSNLKELVNWGIVKSVFKKGDRKEYFEAEKDVWRMFCTITRERKRREIDPALDVLKKCADKTGDMECPECKAFHEQMKQLTEFVEMISSLMDKLSGAEQNKAIPLALKLLT